MYRALVIGAGRIGAGFNWHDDAYTHAGAYKALKDRAELVGFVEPDIDRGIAATQKWGAINYPDLEEALKLARPDIVSVCVQPDQQEAVLDRLPDTLKGVWCEKPLMSTCNEWPWPMQVNYMRRGDQAHRVMRKMSTFMTLTVYGKDDVHTKCHFEDLAAFWKARLDYRAINGPCSYVLHVPGESPSKAVFFDNGGVDGGKCFKAMLTNLLDTIDGKDTLWSPPA